MHSIKTNTTRSLPRVLGVLALAATFALTGCAENSEGGAPGSESGESAAPIEVSKSDDAAKLVPESIKKTGVLRVGVDASYAPNQYAGPDGQPIGWEVELTNAVAAKLDLKVDWQKSNFDQIIPRINGGTLEMGSSSFSDTKKRQESVDFVDFYSAGLQFARGANEKPLPEDLCGIKIGVQATTTSDDYLTEKSKECTDAGKPAINILKKDGQDEVTSDLVLGNIPYMLADSPIAQNSVKQAGDDKVALEGDLFDAAPYGLALPKGGELTQAVQVAMQELIDDGTYKQILEKWGVEAGAVTKAEINGVK